MIHHESLCPFRYLGRIVCRVRGHERFPFAASYWHSAERCARCGVLTDSPMVAPRRWRESPVAGERAEGATSARSNDSGLAGEEFCPTCRCAVAADKSGHMLYGGRLSFTDFEQILLALGASGSDVKSLWPSGHNV